MLTAYNLNNHWLGDHLVPDSHYHQTLPHSALLHGLRAIVLNPDDLGVLGYPVASDNDSTQAVIYKPGRHMFQPAMSEANDLERLKADMKADMKGLFVEPVSAEKKCTRCNRTFIMDSKGMYAAKEKCQFHHGRLQQGKNFYDKVYSCCNQGTSSPGCTNHYYHVWSGPYVGYSGPHQGYRSTTKASGPENTMAGNAFVLDCEMCYTSRGLEACKVTVLDLNGIIVYHKYVIPENPIIDYNTRFSGVSASNYLPHNSPNIRTFRQVQDDLLRFINDETILIGHALDNDMRALKLIHKKYVDTSVTFRHKSGLPFRRPLKELVKTYLYREIQNSNASHDSIVDCRACLQLIFWLVHSNISNVV